jgi:hypothetical protein
MGDINEFRHEHHTMIVVRIHERMTVYEKLTIYLFVKMHYMLWLNSHHQVTHI